MKRILVIVGILVLLFLALPIANLIVGLPETSLALAETGDPARDAALQVLGTKCVNCHTDEYSLPFYARFPIARGIIEADIEKGTRYVDLKAALLPEGDGPVSEVALAKTEQGVVSGSMPPAKYLALHWNGGLSDEEQEVVLTWIKAARIEDYATGTASDEFAAEPVQPIPDTVDLDEKKVALGFKLFHDVRLSKDDTLSCSSCHGLARGGTDQARFSTGVGGKMGDINSPTVFNSGAILAQFWDGRAKDLEEQADGPVNNPIEMASNWDEVIGKLEKDEAFTAQFKAVYPDGYKKEHFLDAIATFERSLITPNSPFDKYLKGDAAAISEEAKDGYRLFKEYSCATCHVGRNLGGGSFELMGRCIDYFEERGDVGKADNGRFNVTEKESDRHAFKVPTLRNIALTFPYLHDGTVTDLEQAVHLMAHCQQGVAIGNDEVAKIVAFLESLTGEYQGTPLK
jgi:cytochrome c peroxidase